MIRLNDDALEFSFPEVHERARMSVSMIRTLRIPDDDKTYPLPPGLGSFPARHADDYGSALGADIEQRGGVVLPMHASEAMWLCFDPAARGHRPYPFALKIAAGKINALTGQAWRPGLHADPQDYVVVPDQPWLDGFVVAEGVIRQFVAEQLGEGYSVEEQLTGQAKFGGLQLLAYPMKARRYEWLVFEDRMERFGAEADFWCRTARERIAPLARLVDATKETILRAESILARTSDIGAELKHLSVQAPNSPEPLDPDRFARLTSKFDRLVAEFHSVTSACPDRSSIYRELDDERPSFLRPSMHALASTSPARHGFAAGGRMRQEVYADPYGVEAWDTAHSSRCFLTVIDAVAWPSITGEEPPTVGPTAKDYDEAGLPWFDYYAPQATSLPGSSVLGRVKSWVEVKKAKGGSPADNGPLAPARVLNVGGGRRPSAAVREPAQPAFEELVAYCADRGRICPAPMPWNRLWELLPQKAQGAGGGWVPALPLVLAGWIYSDDESKRTRFSEHLSWARDHGALDEVAEFLRGLEDFAWHGDGRPGHIGPS